MHIESKEIMWNPSVYYESVTLAAQTIRRMKQNALRLYEQEPQDAQARVQRLGVYLMRWRRWTRAGLRGAGEAFESLAPPALCRVADLGSLGLDTVPPRSRAT